MSKPYRVRVPADLKSLSVIRDLIEKAGADLRVDPDAVSDMVQAVDEAATNLVIHAYRGEPGEIELEVERDGDWFNAHLRDQAPPFDPTTVPPPDLSVPLIERELGGFGCHLMRQFTDKMVYRSDGELWNELTLMIDLTCDSE